MYSISHYINGCFDWVYVHANHLVLQLESQTTTTTRIADSFFSSAQDLNSPVFKTINMDLKPQEFESLFKIAYSALKSIVESVDDLHPDEAAQWMHKRATEALKELNSKI